MENLIRNKEGSSFIWASVIIIVFILLTAIACEYIRLTTIIKKIEDSSQTAVISIATNNWSNNYAGIRQGYSGGYVLEDSRWQEIINKGSIESELAYRLGLTRESNRCVRYENNKISFIIYDIDVDIKNTPLNGKKTDEYVVSLEMILEVPFDFGWGYLQSIKIPIKVKSKYTSKF